MKQKTFSFEIDPQYNLENYVISPHNQAAFEWLFNVSYWQNDPAIKGCLLLAEKGAGKSHLASIVSAASHDFLVFNGSGYLLKSPFDFNEFIILVDDAHKVSSCWLFNLYNHVSSYGGKILLFASNYPKEWSDLKDLDSRLSTLQRFDLAAPDDEEMLLIIKSILKRQGYHINDKMLKKIMPFVERSMIKIDFYCEMIKKILTQKIKDADLKDVFHKPEIESINV